MKFRSWSLALALCASSAGVYAQQLVPVQVGAPLALEVQRLAPQLVGFAGSDANFTNLVNGLALGQPVTLTTPVGTGLTQVVTFTPAGALTALQIAQTLETARQGLIARGISTPTAQQLGIALTGGLLPTGAGPAQLNPLVATASPLGTTTVSSPSPAATLQAGQIPGATTRNTSDSLLPRGISDTPATLPPGATNTSPAVVPFAINTVPRSPAPFATGPAAPNAATGGSAAVPFRR